MAALLIAAEAVNERLKVATAAARRRRLRLVIGDVLLCLDQLCLQAAPIGAL